MKKDTNMIGLLSVASLIAILAGLLFPIAPGLKSGYDVIYGYDLTFGNESIQAITSPLGAYIAVFVLSLIAAVFSVLTTIFGWRGGKFMGFLRVVSGLCLGVSAVLVFIAPTIVSSDAITWSLDWGFIVTGICLAFGALTSLFIGLAPIITKEE